MIQWTHPIWSTGVKSMSLREEIDRLLSENRYEELVERALQNQGIIKFLFRFFYHPYGVQRWQAIEGLGRVAEALVQKDPEAVREIIRRLLWSMNDESGTAGWSAPEAIGEIIYRNPELFKDFVPIVINASEEEIFHRGIAWALGRIGQKRPDLVQESIPLLLEFLHHPRAEVRGYAARSLGQIGPAAGQALPGLEQLLDDRTEVEVYEGNQVVTLQVHQLAREAISKITGEAS
ncbi:HEAT-like repeat-containing protein [Desulforamulus putei DSM 12395]|uniref:HEAT-like repeat-containing protein n=2 Tax=Desulforamulus putei TaxID=74701 RepID=A0A1M5CDN9_9FIRM|nr:HEAT-like repeat-containing protein [Desulforamulus putei DSM 12395]